MFFPLATSQEDGMPVAKLLTIFRDVCPPHMGQLSATLASFFESVFFAELSPAGVFASFPAAAGASFDFSSLSRRTSQPPTIATEAAANSSIAGKR